jgi:hypothetical protein
VQAQELVLSLLGYPEEPIRSGSRRESTEKTQVRAIVRSCDGDSGKIGADRGAISFGRVLNG